MREMEGNRYQKTKFLIVYTVIFIPMSWVVFRYFWNGNRTFLWLPDGWRQHYKGLLYYSKWLREVFSRLFVEHTLELPSFSFSIGYGSDVLTTLHYYVIGDPLTLFSAFVPEEHMLAFYEALVVLRIYLAGAAFACYCFYRRKTNCHAVLAGTFVYIFCSYVLFAGVRHPYFINPMIYLPLLLTGVEKLWREKKPGLFVGSVFVSVVSNFYFFYMIVLLTVLYVVFRLISIYGWKGLKPMLLEVGKLAAYAVIGVMLGAMILLPVMKCFAGNPRLNTGYELRKLYSGRYYGAFLPSLITYGSLGAWTKLGYAVLAVPSVVSMFAGMVSHRKRGRGRRNLPQYPDGCGGDFTASAADAQKAGGSGKTEISRTALGVAFVLLTLFLLLPPAGYAMNGFAYVSNRWGWGFSALVAFIVVTEWEELFHAGWKRRLAVAGISVFYGLLAYLLCRKAAPEILPNLRTALAVLALSLLCMAAAAWFYMKYGKEQARETQKETDVIDVDAADKKKHHTRLVFSVLQSVLLFLVLVNAGATAYYTYSNEQGDYASEFKRQSRFEKDLAKSETDAIVAASAGETEFFRYTGRDLIPNVSLKSGLHNTQFYWSLGNGAVTEYFEEHDIPQGSAFNYMGLDDRTALCALAAVKYHVTRAEEDGYAPYGFQKVSLPAQQEEQYHVYRNLSALPLGYTYKNYMLHGDFLELEALARQEAMLQGVVLSEPVPGYEAVDPVWTGVEQEITENYNSKKTAKTEEGFKTNQKNAVVTYTFDGLPDCETYLVISGLYYDWDQNPAWRDQDQVMTMFASAKDEAGNTLTKSFKYLGVSQDHYNGQHDFVINLGYSESKRVSISLTFPRSGEYRLDSVKVVCQPMDLYDRAVEELGGEVLTKVDLHDDNAVTATSRITGEITLAEPKFLVLAIPYSEGWSAYVDGAEQEVLRANTMFCALALSAGTHRIELRYRTPGLAAGMAVSGLGLSAWIGCLAVSGQRRKKENRCGRHFA